MTEKELSGLYYLNRETERLQKDLRELEYSRAAKPPVLSHAPGRGGPKSDISDLAVEIADLKAIIQLNLLKIQRERARLERYIGNVADPEMRLILRLRHINGMTWEGIGYELGMERTTVSKKHRAYLKKFPTIPIANDV